LKARPVGVGQNFVSESNFRIRRISGAVSHSPRRRRVVRTAASLPYPSRMHARFGRGWEQRGGRDKPGHAPGKRLGAELAVKPTEMPECVSTTAAGDAADGGEPHLSLQPDTGPRKGHRANPKLPAERCWQKRLQDKPDRAIRDERLPHQNGPCTTTPIDTAAGAPERKTGCPHVG
jgi:hypothetical protein